MSKGPLVRQLSIAAAAMLATFSAGATFGYPSVLLYQLRKKDSKYPIALETASWIGSLHGLSGVLGALAPIVVQWKGRKLTFIGACVILITAWMLMYAANGITMVLLSEFILGFSSSVIITVTFDIVTEMITPSYRNVAAQICCVFNALGITTAGVMTRFVHWRLICIILSLPAILAVLISCTWLESPLWLAYKNDIQKCKKNFMKIRGTDEQSLKELEEVIAALKNRLGRNDSEMEVSFVKRLWHQVSSRDFMTPALHVILLLNHISWSGTGAIMIYSIELISKTTQNDTAAFVGVIVIYFVYVFGASISSILVMFCKNKTILLLSTFGATLCLFSAAIVIYCQSIGVLSKESLLCLYFLVGCILASSTGQIPIGITLSTELIPVKHRGIGGALFAIFASSLNASALKISPYLFVYVGLWGTFLIYVLNSTVCGLLIWKFVPETKGKTLQEIENYYSQGTFETRLVSNENKELINKLNLNNNSNLT